MKQNYLRTSKQENINLVLMEFKPRWTGLLQAASEHDEN